MKEEISDQLKDALNTVKGKMLMNKKGHLFSVVDFETEVVIEEGGRTLFGRKRSNKRKLYLTDIYIKAYNFPGEFLGYLREEHIKHMLIFDDFYIMRKNWKDFNKQLNAFGFETIKIKKENDTTREKKSEEVQ